MEKLSAPSFNNDPLSEKTDKDISPFGVDFGMEQDMTTLPMAYTSGTQGYLSEHNNRPPTQDWGDTTEDA